MQHVLLKNPQNTKQRNFSYSFLSRAFCFHPSGYFTQRHANVLCSSPSAFELCYISYQWLSVSDYLWSNMQDCFQKSRDLNVSGLIYFACLKLINFLFSLQHIYNLFLLPYWFPWSEPEILSFLGCLKRGAWYLFCGLQVTFFTANMV